MRRQNHEINEELRKKMKQHRLQLVLNYQICESTPHNIGVDRQVKP